MCCILVHSKHTVDMHSLGGLHCHLAELLLLKLKIIHFHFLKVMVFFVLCL